MSTGQLLESLCRARSDLEESNIRGMIDITGQPHFESEGSKRRRMDPGHIPHPTGGRRYEGKRRPVGVDVGNQGSFKASSNSRSEVGPPREGVSSAVSAERV